MLGLVDQETRPWVNVAVTGRSLKKGEHVDHQSSTMCFLPAASKPAHELAAGVGRSGKTPNYLVRIISKKTQAQHSSAVIAPRSSADINVET